MKNDLTQRCYAGHQPQLAASVYIDPTATVIGQVTVGDHSSIWPMVVIRGDVNTIVIGRRSNIQDGTVIHVARPQPDNPQGYACQIGDQVTVGHKAMLHGCVIESQVLVGMGAILLDGVVVEEQVLIGAGSLVPPSQRLVSGYLYRGSPVHQVRLLSEQERSYLVTSAEHYVSLKKSYE